MHSADRQVTASHPTDTEMGGSAQTPTRPQANEETVRRAVQRIAARHRWNEQEVDDIVRCFDEFDDGYELAKKLENDCGWSITAMLVDDLDSVSSEVSRVNREDCFEWVNACNIQPSLSIGDTITHGVITGISTYAPATYEVQRPNDPPTTKVLIRFEDAKVAGVTP